MSKHRRAALERSIGHVVQGYFDAAFLGGDYPRSSFPHAFDGFTAGTARRARHDVRLLTNKRLGPTTESVRATKEEAYLSVLAPNKVAAGVTARVLLRLVADRGDAPAKRVTLRGRLILTWTPHGWRVFGYDLAHSVAPAHRKAAR